MLTFQNFILRLNKIQVEEMSFPNEMAAANNIVEEGIGYGLKYRKVKSSDIQDIEHLHEQCLPVKFVVKSEILTKTDTIKIFMKQWLMGRSLASQL
jgi:hypothetical protein